MGDFRVLAKTVKMREPLNRNEVRRWPLAASPNLDELQELARTLPPEELPRFLGELETVRCVAFARLTTPATTPPQDELLDVQQVADRLRMSRDWVYRRARKLPFFCNGGTGRALRFSSARLDLYLKQKSR